MFVCSSWRERDCFFDGEEDLFVILVLNCISVAKKNSRKYKKETGCRNCFSGNNSFVARGGAVIC